MPNIFILAIMLSMGLAALMMVYAIVKHTVEKSFYLIFLSVANFFFVFGNLLEMTAPTLESAFYGVRVQYLAAPFIMPLTYLFYRDFYGKKRMTPLQHALFFLIPVLAMLSLQAYPLVRLQYGEIWYTTNGQVVNVQHTCGITYYLSTAQNYVCILLSLWLILERIRHGGKGQRRKSLLMLMGVAAPIAANAIYVFGDGVRGFDLTPIAYITSLAVFLYLALENHLLDSLPLARAQVMDELEDAFIVCDDDFRFLDANLAARRLFPELSSFSQGEQMEKLQEFKEEREMQIWADGEERYYKVTATPILQNTKDSGVCIVFRNATAEYRLLENLKRQAELDGLTGLYNRSTFFDIAKETLHQDGRRKLAFALLLIDVDHFKQVNDTYGHPCGDAVLKALANTVKGHFRSGDVMGRYGGDEFIVLLENISDAQAAVAAEKLCKAIGNIMVSCQENSLSVTISIGVAHRPVGGRQTLDLLLSQADEALYLSKNGGRNRIRLYGGDPCVL
ncbi:MAG: histidine kinase N-terminal 7TM domain-containing diguanylate cyclase [Caproiciproducens sp.]